MNRSNKINKIIYILLFMSFNCLILGAICYVLEDNIEKFKYSDSIEYSSINSGLNLINNLPIQINIKNEYFSGFDSLSNETRESILIAYAIKNNISTYECGEGSSICIDKDSLNSKDIFKVFNTKTKFISTNISLFVDDYGKHSINTTNNSSFYRVVLDNDNHSWRKYTSFSKYKENNDLYIFYVYEGYYKANCTKDKEIQLYDFITGKEVYTTKCSEIENIPKSINKKLQLYKYELKKDKNNEFYLYGYNPVRQ